MYELNLQSLPAAPYGVSNAILPPPNGVENVVALYPGYSAGFTLGFLQEMY